MDLTVRPARPGDAPALGQVMVETWLAAHRGQMPDKVWLRRVEEWTPEVSARGWARLLSEQAAGEHPRTVLLLAGSRTGEPVALVLASEDEDDESGTTAQVKALYVRPDVHCHGTGRLLLACAAAELMSRGFTRLHIGVLTANQPARAFYEAMGGREVGRRTFDEDGVLLSETVYGWPDLADLGGGAPAGGRVDRP